jgi:hypothetical protein
MQHFAENACIMPLVMKACALSTQASLTSALHTLNNKKAQRRQGLGYLTLLKTEICENAQN